MSAVAVARVEGGAVLRVALAAPPRNVLDRAALAALAGALRAVDCARAPDRALKALLLTHEGPSFSYGASVAEHRRAEAPAMLDAFFEAVRALVGVGLPVVAAVGGQCLGAGLELACLATRLVVHEGARLGQPEVRLGAIAPVAALVLPRRVGLARAEDLLLSGRVVDAREAHAIGLADAVTEGSPEEAAARWIREALLPLSASSLRLAYRAARMEADSALLVGLDRQAALYRELLETDDAEEGVAAFLEKRPPRWADR